LVDDIGAVDRSCNTEEVPTGTSTRDIRAAKRRAKVSPTILFFVSVITFFLYQPFFVCQPFFSVPTIFCVLAILLFESDMCQPFHFVCQSFYAFHFILNGFFVNYTYNKLRLFLVRKVMGSTGRRLQMWFVLLAVGFPFYILPDMKCSSIGYSVFLFCFYICRNNNVLHLCQYHHFVAMAMLLLSE
jgi:hypothetical protein